MIGKEGYEVTAVDISEEMMALTQKKIAVLEESTAKGRFFVNG